MNRNLNFILTRLYQGILENREYKANFYMVLLFDSMAVLTMTALMILIESVSSISGWNSFDFFTIVIFTLFNAKIIYGITFRFFNQFLLTGDFNMWITKPISPFYMMITKNMNGANIISILFIILPLVLYLSFIQTGNIFLGWLIFIIGCIFNVFLAWCIELSGFFFKNNTFIRDPIYRTNWFLEDYYPLLFQNAFFFNFIALAPSIITGFLSVSVMKGDFTYLYLLIPPIIATPILGILSYYLYKKGLYEAFG